jgi:hypothetical protein
MRQEQIRARILKELTNRLCELHVNNVHFPRNSQCSQYVFVSIPIVVPALDSWLLAMVIYLQHERSTPRDSTKFFKTVTTTPENKVKNKRAKSSGAFIVLGVTDSSVEHCQILE